MIPRLLAALIELGGFVILWTMISHI